MAVSTASDLVSLYVNTFISQSETEVPFKLLKILVDRFENLESVLSDINDLNNIDNLYGKSLELRAEKWSIFRKGKKDTEFLDNLKDRIYVFYYSSALPDLKRVLENFDAPTGSTLQELEYQDAEIEVKINNASTEIFNRIKNVLGRVKAAGVELDIYNVLDTGDNLLYEDGSVVLYQDGDEILLE